MDLEGKNNNINLFLHKLILMRIALAWWGTGWHVMPIQSLVKFINNTYPRKYSFFWFGEKKSLEETTCIALQKIVPQLSFLPIYSGKRRREKWFMSFLRNCKDLLLLVIGICQSLWLLRKKHIDVIFCKGWYVSLPVVIAGWMWRKKIILHESDTTPGLANRICSRFATTIFTWFSDVFPWKEKVIGQILDDDLVWYELAIKDDKDIAAKTHILVTWWSQWSESIYLTLHKIIDVISSSNVHVHIIFGTKNTQHKVLFDGYENITGYDFIDQKVMWGLLDMCDVAITRGGTTSLAEQELFGIKKIIIPIPRTHDQAKNATYYKVHHDDIVLDQYSNTFVEELQNALQKYIWYKKLGYVSPLDKIQQTKMRLLVSME